MKGESMEEDVYTLPEVEDLLLGNIQDLRFMGRCDLIDFAINAKTLRDGLSDYYDTTLSSLLKNPLITRYLEVIDELDFLIDDIRDEVAEQAAQFGEQERRDNGWVDVSMKAVAARKKAEKARQKKRKRKYTRKQGG